MLLINPKSVVFFGALLPGVRSITIDRKADTLAEEWLDAGPHQVFCDATKVRTVVRVVQQLEVGDAAALAASPLPGVQGQLAFAASMNNGPHPCQVSMTACVVGVTTELPPGPIAAPGPGGGSPKVAVRTITLHAISGTGLADPVLTSPL